MPEGVLCKAMKRSGEPCTLSARGGSGYCWAHDPVNAQRRSQMASKAAKSKGSAEIREVTSKLAKLADDVLEGSVDKATGSVVAQILGVLIRGIEQERKQREQEEFESRLEALEQTQEKGGNHWWTG